MLVLGSGVVGGACGWVAGWAGLWGVPPTWVWVGGFSPLTLEHPTSICDTGIKECLREGSCGDSLLKLPPLALMLHCLLTLTDKAKLLEKATTESYCSVTCNIVLKVMMYFSFMVGMDTMVLALAPWEFLHTAHGNSTFLLTLAFSRSVGNNKRKK